MRLCILILFLSVSITSLAQKETSNWFFSGSHAVITPSGISNANPSAISQQFYPGAASTSVSDAAGNLLFAADEATIIDQNFSVMPALVNKRLQGGSKVLAIKIPGSQRYYVFYANTTSYSTNSQWNLNYAIVDLSLNNGKGDVTVFNQLIDSNLSRAFTLVQSKNSEDAWLVTHRWGTTQFLCYQITASGLSTTPVTCNAGTVATTGNYIFADLKTSHDGSMIAGLAYRDYTVFFAETHAFLE